MAEVVINGSWVLVHFLRESLQNYKMDHLTAASFVATCIIIFMIFSIILKLRPQRDLYEKVSKFPGPPTLPLIGNAHLFTGSTEAILDKVTELSKLYPAPCRAWIGNCAIIYINSPEQLRVVLNSPKTMDKGPFLFFIGSWLGTGLLTAPAAKWRVHRKLIQPTFSLTILQSFVGIFSAKSATMAEAMKRHLDGAEFDVFNYTSECALHTICETTMGVNLETDGHGCYAKIVNKVASSISRRFVSPWLHPDSIFYLTKLGQNQKKNIKYLHDFTDNVIRSKKDLLLKENIQPIGSADKEEDTESGIPRRKILLDHLLEVSHNSKTFSDEALREEVDTIITTGSDTTAVMSSYVMLMLASHPEVQENAYEELCEIYVVDDTEELHFTPANLTRMNYMERVIKETMRLFPITPFLERSVMDDLDIGEHTFPKGSQVILSIMDIHRNGKYWPDPMRFDPDRFLPEEVEKRHPYAYLAFGGGPRSCIGSKYAMMSMKILLSTILRKYILKKDTIVPVKDLRFKWEMVLRPVDPITLRIERRTRNTFASI